MPEHAYLIICGGIFDQVCETAEDANREATDLRKSALAQVTIKVVPWAEQDAEIDKIENR